MEIRLTYHAVRRYLERIEGINLKPVFAEMRKLGYARRELMLYLEHEFGLYPALLSAAMLPEKIVRSARNCMGNTKAKHNGHTYVFEDWTLLTIYKGPV